MNKKAITKANKILYDLNFDKHRSTTQIVAEGLQEYANEQLQVSKSLPSKSEIQKYIKEQP